MIARVLVAAWIALVMVAGSIAGADSARGSAPRAPVKCHWVKATKKRKRHKVCVKVKATKKKRGTVTGAKPASSAMPAPAVPPASVVPPAPAAAAPVAGDPIAAAPAPDPAATPAAARLQATTHEWSIVLSRPTIPAGPLTLELVNRGEDAHDLHVRPAAGGADVASVARTDSLGVTDLDANLPAGTYTLYCSLPGHESAGMHATLTVQ